MRLHLSFQQIIRHLRSPLGVNLLSREGNSQTGHRMPAHLEEHVSWGILQWLLFQREVVLSWQHCTWFQQDLKDGREDLWTTVELDYTRLFISLTAGAGTRSMSLLSPTSRPSWSSSDWLSECTWTMNDQDLEDVSRQLFIKIRSQGPFSIGISLLLSGGCPCPFDKWVLHEYKRIMNPFIKNYLTLKTGSL